MKINMDINLFKSIRLENFKKIKLGWIINCRVGNELFAYRTTSDAFYNADCDEPGWEINTENGTFSWDSVYVKKDDEDTNRNKVQAMWKNLLEMLPHQPRSFDSSEDTGYWTNGSEILCNSEMEREIIADFLEDIFSEWGGYKMKTGYYDPFEDARNGETDDNTGFYYIDMEE